MFRFTIRDVLWLTVVVAVTLLMIKQRRDHHVEVQALKATTEKMSTVCEGLQWQLMHATSELEAEGFTVESDHKRFNVVGPSKHGYDTIRIGKIKNGESIQIMADGKDVTRRFIRPSAPAGTQPIP